MRKSLTILLLCVAIASGCAQRVIHTFRKTPLAEALKYLDRQSSRYNISFLYDELEAFTVTTDVRSITIPDAVRQVVGFYPMRVTCEDSLIVVECTQKDAQKLIGRIVDNEGQPMAYANIALLNPADSAFLNGGVSNADGDFVIPCTPVGEEGKVLARVSYVGYRTLWRLASMGHTGTWQLQPDTRTLSGVEIQGYKPAYKMIPGGMEVDVEHSLLAQAGSVRDVLSQLPRLQVDAGGAVTVFGKGTPEIYVNGRKLRDNSQLEQLKSADIRTIDVLTAPGAQYNAEVDAVIRIRTRRRQGDGLSLSTILSPSWNRRPGLSGGPKVTFRTKGLEVYGGIWMTDEYGGERNHLTYTLRPEGRTIVIDQHPYYSNRYRFAGPQTGFSYDFSDRHSVGASCKLELQLPSRRYSYGPMDIRRNGSDAGHVDQRTDLDIHSGPDQELNAYYRGKFGPVEVNADGTMVAHKTNTGQTVSETSPTLEDRTVHITAQQRSRLCAGKMTASYALAHGSLTAGTELTRTRTDALNRNPEGYVNESDTRIREQNTAAFASAEWNAGCWTFEAGLRYEHVRSDYYLYGAYDGDLSRRYSQWFPDASVAYGSGAWHWQLSYSKRVRRPAYWQMRSFQQYNNRYAYEGGNPQLHPAIRHNIEWSAQWKWLNVSVDYTRTRDHLFWVHELHAGQEAVHTRTINISHWRHLGISIYGMPRFGFYQPIFDLEYQQQFFHARSLGMLTNMRRPSVHIAVTNRFMIRKVSWVALELYGQSANDAGYVESRASGGVNISAFRSFLHDRLTVNFYFNDLFNTDKECWQIRSCYLEISKDCDNLQREVGLRISFQLNTSRSRYKGTGAGTDEKKRL